jgi:hypothetical protein
VLAEIVADLGQPHDPRHHPADSARRLGRQSADAHQLPPSAVIADPSTADLLPGSGV